MENNTTLTKEDFLAGKQFIYQNNKYRLQFTGANRHLYNEKNNVVAHASNITDTQFRVSYAFFSTLAEAFIPFSACQLVNP